eukprot:8398832-Alexandrium_andersonii.AAC.1
MQPSDAAGAGAGNLQRGQAGKAQRRGSNAALKEAWRKERQGQQWWAARPGVLDDVRGGNTAVQIPHTLKAAYAEYKIEITQQLA